MQAKVCQLYCTSFCCFPKLISFKNSWSCNSSALASEILCIFHAALLWRQSRWAASVLLGAGWTYPDVFLEGPGQGAPPLLRWASEVQSYGPVAPRVLYSSGSQTGGRGPPGGHKMALGGPQRNSRIFFFFFLPVCKSGFSYLNYDVFKKNWNI